MRTGAPVVRLSDNAHYDIQAFETTGMHFWDIRTEHTSLPWPRRVGRVTISPG